MAVKRPGFIDSAGNRNKRVNRYASAGDNRSDIRHKQTDGITLAFVAPDQVTDANNDLDKFRVGEFVDAEKSVAQDGVYEVATVVAGQLDMVEQTITAENAGPSIAVRSRNNRIDSRLA